MKKPEEIPDMTTLRAADRPRGAKQFRRQPARPDELRRPERHPDGRCIAGGQGVTLDLPVQFCRGMTDDFIAQEDRIMENRNDRKAD
ncbi:MAG: hypothetical protein P3W90_003280 [Paracoccus sp. (in: a-proteobacteria)]|nr:hypothetical protein [Paracoccus sp. (in: a-proteobacteria)]